METIKELIQQKNEIEYKIENYYKNKNQKNIRLPKYFSNSYEYYKVYEKSTFKELYKVICVDSVNNSVVIDDNIDLLDIQKKTYEISEENFYKETYDIINLISKHLEREIKNEKC